MIFVNCKTYKEASGKNAARLSQVINATSERSGVEIIACPQATDLREVVEVAKSSRLPAGRQVWVQHVDAVKRGRATGWFPAEVAKEAGAEGVLLNHSEHKLTLGVLGETLTRCKEVGLQTLVFADSLKEAFLIAKLEPDLVGYEPPELVASKSTSVSKAKPDIIKKVVKSIPNTPILIGAGIKDGNDIKIGIDLGAKGVVVSSAIILAQDWEEKLLELAKGFNK